MNTNPFPMATEQDSEQAIAYAAKIYTSTYQKAIEDGLSQQTAESLAMLAFRSAEGNWYAIHFAIPSGRKVD